MISYGPHGEVNMSAQGRVPTKYTVLDLFAGCGGFSLGFRKAGFNIAAANDKWKVATNTFKKNFLESEVICGDLSKKEIQDRIIQKYEDKIDVIIGGPPCQAFSLAGARNLEDPRGKLFDAYFVIVKKIKPKVVVLENVKGILSMKHFMDDTPIAIKKEYMEKNAEIKNKKQKIKIKDIENLYSKYLVPVVDVITKEFEKLKYKMDIKKMNSRDFGVPQSRDRVFFIGNSLNIVNKFPAPTHYSREEKKPHYSTLKSAIGHLSFPELTEGDECYFGGYSYIFMSRNRRRKWNDQSFTIQATARHAPLHPSSPPMEKVSLNVWKFTKGLRRSLSVKECALIQTFPPTFIFEGSMNQKYRQIGNAVPPKMAKQIAVSVKDMLENNIDVQRDE